MWAALAGIFSGAGTQIVKGLGYLLAIAGIYIAGRQSVEKADAQKTVDEARAAAKNRSDVSGLTDADLDRELQPPHK